MVQLDHARLTHTAVRACRTGLGVHARCDLAAGTLLFTEPAAIEVNHPISNHAIMERFSALDGMAQVRPVQFQYTPLAAPICYSVLQ